MNAPKIILAHNHPSGNSEPSKQDINFTYEIYEYATVMGIELVDHLVIGNREYTSIFTKLIQTKEDKNKGLGERNVILWNFLTLGQKI